MNPLRGLLVAGLIAVVCTSTGRAGPFTGLVSFGDSLTDTGNLFLAVGGGFPFTPDGLLPTPPYSNGRASNGPVAVEALAAGLGLQVLPSLAGGTNYAFINARTGPGTTPEGIPNIGLQVQTYLGDHTPTGSELFAVLGGANDFLFDGQTDPSVPVANLVAAITALATAGGQHFLVANLPPLGAAPGVRELGPPSVDLFNGLTVAFNTELDLALDQLEVTLGITTYRPDVFGITQAILADPAAFGFTNVTDPAFDLATGLVVPNPDEYLFWDETHPTAVTHALYGRLALASVVPEPSSLVLCVLGALGPIGIAVRHARRSA